MLNAIKEGADLSVIDILNRQLADTLDLRSQTREASFNIRECREDLRPLFDGLSRDLRELADLIAEKISDAGGYAIGNVRAVARESRLRDYPDEVLNAGEQLRALLSSHSRYELNTICNLNTLRARGDFETIKVFDPVLAFIENSLWFLEAYLEGIAVGLHGRKLPLWTSSLSTQRMFRLAAASSEPSVK